MSGVGFERQCLNAWWGFGASKLAKEPPERDPNAVAHQRDEYQQNEQDDEKRDEVATGSSRLFLIEYFQKVNF